MKRWIEVAGFVGTLLLALGGLTTLPAWGQSTPLLIFFDRGVAFDREFQQTLTDLFHKDGEGFKFALLARNEEKTKQAMAYYEVGEDELPIVLILTKDADEVEKRLPQKRSGSSRDAAWDIFRRITEKPVPLSQATPGDSPPPASIGELTNPKDGAMMVYIPAGEFVMGTSEAQINSLFVEFPGLRRPWFDNEKPQRTVYLDGYWIYKYEVTVAQYRTFCQETGREMPDAPPWGWHEDHPIVKVTWDDAVAYSQWAGVELPTEAQWEKAARGTNGRLWPWGTEWDSSKCNSAGVVGQTTPVGSYPAGASSYGVMDMGGNVWEWCADWYDENYYHLQPSRNPQGPASGTWRVLRGGSWPNVQNAVRAANRYRSFPSIKNDYRGFRCVSPRSPR